MYVSDNKVVFSLQGLRFISKEDYLSTMSGKGGFRLTLQYKGSDKTIMYDTADERDAIYDLAVRLIKAKSVDRDTE